MEHQECSIMMTVASEFYKTVQLLADKVYLIFKTPLNVQIGANDGQ